MQEATYEETKAVNDHLRDCLRCYSEMLSKQPNTDRMCKIGGRLTEEYVAAWMAEETK